MSEREPFAFRRVSGALFPNNMNSLNKWLYGVSKKEDMFVKRYWDYLAKSKERHCNLLYMHQMFRDVT